MLPYLDRAFRLVLRAGAVIALVGSAMYGSAIYGGAMPGGLVSAAPQAQADGGLRPAPQAAPQAQIDINGPAGSGSFGSTVTVLANGNFVVTDPTYSAPGPVASVGAVYLYNGATRALVSTLTGTTANDGVGTAITALANGSYVVSSPLWDNATAVDAGAVTWCSGTAGCTGPVTPANSLVGGAANDGVGAGSSFAGILALANGSYIVTSPQWDNGSAIDAGAATWCSGAAGCTGLVTQANSLVGSTAHSRVGSNGVRALPNGNLLVNSPGWSDGVTPRVGAVTWCAATGCTGPVTPANSLVGGPAGDQTGSDGITLLANGNYVVSLSNWDNGDIPEAGAVTWCSGAAGCTGPITQANSLTGSTVNDWVGSNGIQALANGNYVVSSPWWDDGETADVGAVTLCSGTAGCTGPVASANSLTGSTLTDMVGAEVKPLTNGNYVVSSPYWSNAGTFNAGAVTWCSGATGCTGPVTSANSLVGSSLMDGVGNGITALANGSYVVSSPGWNNDEAAQAGALTWCSGAAGCTGPVTPANSLVGSSADDQVGSNGVTALANGNYVSSPWWDDGATPSVGAATWCSGAAGCTGPITLANSLTGSTANDQVSSNGITVLTNGHYVVSSPDWNDGTTTGVGAVTWCSGTTGRKGLVTLANSLVGSTALDGVGWDGITALANGNYVVMSLGWDNGAIIDAGAVTLVDGSRTIAGSITAGNSVRGTLENETFVPVYDGVIGKLLVGRPISNIVSVFGFGLGSRLYLPMIVK